MNSNVVNYNGIKVRWEERVNESMNTSGGSEKWLTIEEFPDITFALTKFSFGEEGQDNKVPFNFTVRFETKEQERLSMESEGFEAVLGKLILEMMKTAEMYARSILDEKPVDADHENLFGID